MAAVAYGVTMALMALAPTVPVALALGVVLGLSSITFLVASTAIVQMRSAAEMRGRVLALQAMLFLGSTPVGGPIVGWVAEELGARYSIGLGAVAAVGAGLWGLAAVRRTDAGTVPADGLAGVAHAEAAPPAVAGAVLDPSVTASGFAPVAGGEGPAPKVA
jgi:MFS family permease